MMSRIRFGVVVSLLVMGIGCKTPAEPVWPPAIDSTLSLRWKVFKQSVNTSPSPSTGVVLTQPVIDAGKLFVACDSAIRCLDLQTGATIWSASMLAPVPMHAVADLWSENMIVEKGHVIVVASNYVVCVDEATGSKIWGWAAVASNSNGFLGYVGDMFNTYSQSGDAIFLNLNYYPGEVIKLSKASGAVLWDTKGTMIQSPAYAGVESSCAGRSPTYLDGRVYVGYSYGASQIKGGVYHDGSLVCLDAVTGNILWNNLIPKLDTMLGGNQYVATDNSADGNVIPYNHTIILKTGTSTTRFDSSGRRIWRAVCSDNGLVSRTPYSPRLFGDKLFVFNQPSDTHLHRLDPETGNEFWSKQISENGTSTHTFVGPYAPSFENGIMYLLSDDGWMFGVNMTSGVVEASSNLGRQIPLEDDDILGGFMVQGGLVTVVDVRYILCWKAARLR
jgi:outer membrane protein assembly factor BamB